MAMYAFLEDDIFVNPSNPEFTPPVGKWLPELDSMLTNKQIIEDNRANRLIIPFHKESFSFDTFITDLLWETYSKVLLTYGLPPDDTELVQIFYDQTQYLLDQNIDQYVNGTFQADRACKMKLIYDYQLLETSDINYLASMTEQEFQGLFNILEFCSLGITMGMTEEDIDAYLKSLPNTFIFYKPGSFKVTSKRTLAYLFCNVNLYRLIPNSFEFALEKSGGYLLQLKVWTKPIAFQKEYPLSIIDVIIPPTDLQTLLNLDTLEDIYAALYESKETTYEKLINHLNHSYSGVLKYDLIYHKGDLLKPVSFLILYRGRTPSDLTIREAIRGYLLSSGVGTEETWKTIFPDLFVLNSFYIIPIWDEIFSTPGEILFSPIVKNTKILNVLTKFNSTVVPTSVINQYEELSNGVYDVLLLCIHDMDNQTYTDLRSMFPDYLAITPQNPKFNLLSSDTQEFISKLNQALGQAKDNITDDLPIVKMNNYDFVKFSCKESNFYVMTKNSYLNLIQY